MITQKSNAEKKANVLKKINASYRFLVGNSYSSFYKQKYKNAGIRLKNLETIEDFKRLPFLTKDEILNSGPYAFFFLPKNKIEFIGFSSGTTNQQNPLIIFGSKNTPAYDKFIHKKQLELKINALLMLYSVLPTQQRLMFDGNLKKYGIPTAYGDINNLSLTAKIAKTVRTDCIQTTPTILYYLIPHLKKEINLDSIKMVILGGEYCSEEKFKYFKKLFKNAYFKFNFGGAETGHKGYRCDLLASSFAPRFFHPIDSRFHYELDEKHDNELILTSLTKGNWPFLIRYKTGDSVKITEYKCKCGNTRLMEVFGKMESDLIKISGTSIYASNIYQVLSPLSKNLAYLDFKLHVYEKTHNNKIMPRLILQLVAKKGLQNIDLIKQNVQKQVSDNLYLTQNSTLSDLVEKKVFLPLEIEFIEELAFAQKHRAIISHLI